MSCDIIRLCVLLQNCFTHAQSWMSDNKLKLNCDKTEAIRFCKKSARISPSLPPFLTLSDNDIYFSDSVRDLGILLDSDLSMKQHVAKTCQLAYIELRRISSIRSYLSEESTKKLVSSYILSRLDYGNAALLGCPSSVIRPLQHIQNSAARLICQASRTQPCSPLLHKLHWLPVEQRIIYKCCCLCFKVIIGSAPAYLSDLLYLYAPARTLRSSADNRLFRLPHFHRKQHGQRAFSVLAPTVWNALPYSVRHIL